MKILKLSFLSLITILMVSCTGAKPAATPAPSPSATPTPVASATATATATTAASTAPATTPATVRTKVNIGTLIGPTGLGMVKMMDDSANCTSINDYNFTTTGEPANIVGKIVSGELDIAAVPNNLASTIYNKTGGKITYLGINTLGMLYIVENGMDIKSIADLKGKTLAATGQGAVPEYVLDYILAKNNLTVGKDINVTYNADHSALSALVVSGKVNLALLPEPFVTSTIMQNKNVKIALNLNDDWKTLNNGKMLPMGGIIVRNDFLAKNKDAVLTFMKEYAASIEYTNKNLDGAATLAEKYKIVPKAAIAKAAIPTCNIVWITDASVKDTLNGFYDVLYKQNPASIGGKIPDDAFYFNK